MFTLIYYLIIMLKIILQSNMVSNLIDLIKKLMKFFCNIYIKKKQFAMLCIFAWLEIMSFEKLH